MPGTGAENEAWGQSAWWPSTEEYWKYDTGEYGGDSLVPPPGLDPIGSEDPYLKLEGLVADTTKFVTAFLEECHFLADEMGYEHSWMGKLFEEGIYYIKIDDEVVSAVESLLKLKVAYDRCAGRRAMVKRLNAAFRYVYDAITVRTQIRVRMGKRGEYLDLQREAFQKIFRKQSREIDWNQETSRLMQSYNKVIRGNRLEANFLPIQCFKSQNQIDNEKRKNGKRARRERKPKEPSEPIRMLWVEETPSIQSWFDESPSSKMTEKRVNRARSSSSLSSIQPGGALLNPEYETLFKESFEMESCGEITENVQCEILSVESMEMKAGGQIVYQ